MNSNEVTQLILVGHMTVTIGQMQYIQISFILLHTFILYNAHRAITYSKKYLRREYVISGAANEKEKDSHLISKWLPP